MCQSAASTIDDARRTPAEAKTSLAASSEVSHAIEPPTASVPRSPFNAGAVVVTLVRPETSWRDGAFAELSPVKVRLHDADRFGRAEWLGVEKSADGAVPCDMQRDGAEITIPIPPLGAAGVLKLS